MQQTLQAWRAIQGPFRPPTERRGALATLALAAVQVEVPAWAQSIPLGLVAADPTRRATAKCCRCCWLLVVAALPGAHSVKTSHPLLHGLRAVHPLLPGAVVPPGVHLLKAVHPFLPGAAVPLKVHVLNLVVHRVFPLLPSSTRAAALQQAPKVETTVLPAETMLVEAFLIH